MFLMFNANAVTQQLAKNSSGNLKSVKNHHVRFALVNSHHRNSVCAGQCELSCDWRSTPADRAGTSGRTLAPRSAAAEPEADGADTHSRSPPAHSQKQTYNNNNSREQRYRQKYVHSSCWSLFVSVLLQQILGQSLRGQEGRKTRGEQEPASFWIQNIRIPPNLTERRKENQRVGWEWNQLSSYVLSFLFHTFKKGIGSHLIGYLSQDLITEAGIGQSSLDDVVPKEILLSPIQVRVTHEPEYLSKSHAHTVIWKAILSIFKGCKVCL